MKKIMILGFLVGLMVAGTYCNMGSLKALTAQQITSPSLECTVNKNLIDKDNKKLKAIDANIIQKDNKLTIKIKNSSDEEGEKEFNIASDEKMFVVIKDRLNLKPQLNYFLTEQQNGEFQVEANMPFFYDMINLYFYKQKKSDPDFKVSDDNFIGKTKICMRNITAFYLPGQKFKITDVIGTKKSNIYIRALPNFYRIDIEKDDDSENRKITKIELPESQKDKMTNEAKVNSFEDVKIIYPSGEDSGAFYASFYIPKEITEFSFLVYEEEITNKTTDVINKYNIKLEKK